MKVGIFSDLHLQKGGKKIDGVWDKKLVDGLAVLGEVVETFINNKVDAFIFLGDFFDRRYQIDVQILHGAIEVLMQLKDMPGIFVLGNHDVYTRTREIHSLMFSSLRWLVVDEGLTVFPKDSIWAFKYVFIPYQREYSIVDYRDVNKWCGNRIVCMHQILQGFPYQNNYTPYSREVFDYTKLRDYRMILSGHCHKQGRKDNVVQVGSVMQLNFGDVGDENRGCWILDDETLNLQFYPLNFPRYVVLDYDKDTIPVGDNDYYRLQIKESDFNTLGKIPSNITDIQLITEEKVIDRLDLGKKWDWNDAIKKYTGLMQKQKEYVDAGINLIKGIIQ